MTDNRKTIKIDPEVFEKLNDRRKEHNMSWSTYLDIVGKRVLSPEQQERRKQEVLEEVEKRLEESRLELREEMEDQYGLSS